MQTIPIKLTATPVPVGISYSDINQLLTLIARYTSAQISDDVTFVLVGASDPTTFVTLLFFNTSQGVWKYWDTGRGAYLAVTPFLPGDTKTTFLQGDQIPQGWVMLDGRKISAIENLSQNQAQVLTTLFGIDGSLPTVTPISSLQDMPVNGAVSSIPVLDIQPPNGQIAALPFGSAYDPSQSQALATNAETLRNSTSDLKTSVAAIQAQTELMLQSLNGGNTGVALYALVFCGYP